MAADFFSEPQKYYKKIFLEYFAGLFFFFFHVIKVQMHYQNADFVFVSLEKYVPTIFRKL